MITWWSTISWIAFTYFNNLFKQLLIVTSLLGVASIIKESLCGKNLNQPHKTKIFLNIQFDVKAINFDH